MKEQTEDNFNKTTNSEYNFTFNKTFEEKDFKDKVRMKLELYKESDLINSWDFFNNLLILEQSFTGVPALGLDKKKTVSKDTKHLLDPNGTDENKPYSLLCRVERNEISESFLVLCH